MDSHRSTSTLDPETPDGETLDAPHPNPPREPHALGLSFAQVTGSALAAVSGAVLAAWLGVTGTLIGAAVGSVIGTVGSATYTYSLQRGRDVVVAGRNGVKPAGPTAAGAPVPTRPARRATELRATWRDWPWKRLTAAAAAALVLGIGTLTVLELVAGEPVSSIAGGDDSSRTTLGGVISGGRSGGGSQNQQEDTPVTPDTPTSPAPSEQPQPSEEPTEAPTEEPTPTPEPSPSVDPATPVPPSPGTGDGGTE
jgi:hypothetical protein